MVKAQSYPTSQSRFLGGITAVVGPNGSGKSTVLRALARLLSPTQRAIYLNGDNIAKLSTRAIARQLAILPPIAPNPGRRDSLGTNWLWSLSPSGTTQGHFQS